MTELTNTVDVVSIKFRNRGKLYYFDPAGIPVKAGQKVVVETSKGLELGAVAQAPHAVPEEKTVQPLRPVVRVATEDDLRIEALCRKREREAYIVGRQKIAAHGLDMKLVDVECSFEGNKILFFFSSDGRVDFRELVKDLAGVFRTRIELRQIGVRDEARILGGLGICGRPFCCGIFMEEFAPVPTKMAKLQSMSLNPSKISGCCGRLMCCLRYEQAAYEELHKHVPKNGAFVETPDGYGNVVQVNVLRQLVKVKLDGPGEDSFHTYEAEDVATVPGGRPKDGSQPPHVLVLRPKKREEEDDQQPVLPNRLISDSETRPVSVRQELNRRTVGNRSRNRREQNAGAPAEAHKKQPKQPPAAKPEAKAAEKPTAAKRRSQKRPNKPQAHDNAQANQPQERRQAEKPTEAHGAPKQKKPYHNYRRHNGGKNKNGGSSAPKQGE